MKIEVGNTPKGKKSGAERASEWYARDVHGCVVAQRAVRTKFQKVDFFACDCVGKTSDGSHVYLQVTAGNDTQVTKRRRKIEEIPWHTSDHVLILQLAYLVDPSHKGRKLWWFIEHVYSLVSFANNEPSGNDRKWKTRKPPFSIPKHWFSVWNEKRSSAAPMKKQWIF